MREYLAIKAHQYQRHAAYAADRQDIWRLRGDVVEACFWQKRAADYALFARFYLFSLIDLTDDQK